tara:strand:+ start:8992 stop:9903 length:912 start_codon:yes stop_codon:yes gene_type:complete
MEILINLVIFVIVLFLYLHISFQLKINNDLEVLEIEEPTKGQLEEICDLRQPVLFNFNNKISDEIQLDNIFNNYSAFDIKIRNKNKIEKDQELYLPLSLKELKVVFENDKEKKYISEKNQEFLEETSLIKHFNNNDLFLRPEFVSTCNYDLLFGNKDSYTPFRYDIYYRNYLVVTQGKIIIRLTPPKNQKYLDLEKDYEILEYKSKIDVWNVDDKNRSNYDKIKFLDIELNKNQILYIPAYWFFSIKYLEKSLICNFKYSTFMNLVAILPEYTMHILQHNNTKKQVTKIKKIINTKNIENKIS